MERRETPAEVARKAGWIAVTVLAIFIGWIVADAQGLGIGFFYLLPVSMASWWFGVRWGFALAGACTGLYVAGAALQPVQDLALSAALRAVIFGAGAVVIAALRSSRRRLQLSNEELEALREALTPPALPKIPGVDAAAAFLPAEHGVAGDFYLMTNAADGAVVVVVGDVVGHGPEAASLATFARTSIVAFASNSSDPAAILKLANEALVERGRGETEFVTALCVAYQPADWSLRCASAGHYPPIRIPELEELTTVRAEPLGLSPTMALDTQRITLQPDQGVLMFTDGLLEAPGAGGRFGKERLVDVLRGAGPASSATLVEELRKALIDFTGSALPDDVCLVAVQAEGHAQRPIAARCPGVAARKP